MGFRSDFYSRLAEEVYDFSLDRDGINNLPFLAKQMKDLKTFAPRSAVAVLETLSNRFRNGDIGNKEYFCSMLETAIRKRIRIQEQIYIAAERCRDMFPHPEAVIDDPEMSASSDSNKRKRLFYRRTQLILDSMRPVPDEPLPGCDKALVSLSQLLMAEALVAEAKAWLYDAGFPSRKDKDIKPRKIDRSLLLVDRFFEEKSLDMQSALSGADSKDASLKDDTKKLFSLMRRDPEYSRAVIPVTVDPSSGTGLYIYGIESDDKNSRYAFGNNRELIRLVNSEGYTCYFTVFEYRYTERVEDGEYPETGPARINYLQHVINEGSEDECVGYPDLDDAWHDYIQAVSRKETYISYENASAPEGCPQYFRQFFSDYDPGQQTGGPDDIGIDLYSSRKPGEYDPEEKWSRNETDAGSLSSYRL